MQIVALLLRKNTLGLLPWIQKRKSAFYVLKLFSLADFEPSCISFAYPPDDESSGDLIYLMLAAAMVPSQHLKMGKGSKG